MGVCDPTHPCEACRRLAAAAVLVPSTLAKPGDIRRIKSGPLRGRIYEKTITGGWRRLKTLEAQEAREGRRS